MQEVDQFKIQLDSLKIQLQNLTEQNDSLQKQLQQFTESIKKLDTDNCDLQERNEELQRQIDDIIAEKQIVTKKCENELKQLKGTLGSQKKEIEKLKEEKENSKTDLKNVMERLKEYDLKPAQMISKKELGQEKLIVESLSNQVQELQNANSKQQTIQNKQAKQIDDLKLIIGEKDIFINQVISQLQISNPNFKQNTDVDIEEVKLFQQSLGKPYFVLQENLEVENNFNLFYKQENIFGEYSIAQRYDDIRC